MPRPYRTEHSVALARHAQAAGATAVMVSAPYYMGAHVDAVWRHLASVREAVSVPVMLYHVPATTNVELPLEVLRELVDADVIHAVKQSFYDAYHTRDAKIALGGDAAVYCGHDGSALECLLMGADGWISALPALYPSLARRLWDGVQAGEPVATLRDQWFRLLPLVRMIFDPAGRDDRGAPHWLELMHAAAGSWARMWASPGPPSPRWPGQTGTAWPGSCPRSVRPPRGARAGWVTRRPGRSGGPAAGRTHRRAAGARSRSPGPPGSRAS